MARIRERGWVRSLTAVERPELRVVCFPYSGGSATAFGGWSTALPPGVELVALQYPGRGDRFGEDFMDDVAAMAAHATAELLRLAPSPCVLFGHSLGALVAYETAQALRNAGAEPRQLCVSGSPAPALAVGGRIHLAPDDEFWTTLCGLGGIAPGIAESAELREILLPMLRADVRAHETYRPRPAAPPLSCPVRCYHGAGDPLVEEVRLGEWAQITSGDFTLRVRPGGHFHVATDTAGLVADIVRQGGA
ncbi:thioesterase II family protein [Streptomyces sp. C184]|uniref:thioesterase II family protein n=1 Tax=Streptomyces sp. C184 TaxID=3237121 RepID=UPI0034C5DDAE